MKNPALTLFMSWLLLWSGCGQFMAADAMRLLTDNPPFSKNPLSASTENDPFGFDFSQMNTFLNNPQAMLHKPRLMVNLLTQLGQWARQASANLENFSQFHQMKVGIHDIHRFFNERKHDMFRTFNVDQETRQLMNRANDELLEFGIRHNCGEIFNNLGNRKLGFGCDLAPSNHQGRNLLWTKNDEMGIRYAFLPALYTILWLVYLNFHIITRPSPYQNVLRFLYLCTRTYMLFSLITATDSLEDSSLYTNIFERNSFLLFPLIFTADLLVVWILPGAIKRCKEQWTQVRGNYLLRHNGYFRDPDPPVEENAQQNNEIELQENRVGVNDENAPETNDNEHQENSVEPNDNRNNVIIVEPNENEPIVQVSEIEPAENTGEIQPATDNDNPADSESEDPEGPRHECPICFETFQHGVEVDGNSFKQFYGCSHGGCRQCLEQMIRNGMRTCHFCRGKIITKKKFKKQQKQQRKAESDPDGSVRRFMQRIRQPRAAGNEEVVEPAIVPVPEEEIPNDIEAQNESDNFESIPEMTESETEMDNNENNDSDPDTDQAASSSRSRN